MYMPTTTTGDGNDDNADDDNANDDDDDVDDEDYDEAADIDNDDDSDDDHDSKDDDDEDADDHLNARRAGRVGHGWVAAGSRVGRGSGWGLDAAAQEKNKKRKKHSGRHHSPCHHAPREFHDAVRGPPPLTLTY